MQRIKNILSRVKENLAGLVFGDACDEVTELVVAEIDPPNRLARCWVRGYLRRHSFEALLYPRHAKRPEIELRRSRISKLCVRQMDNEQIVAAFDRGWTLPPNTDIARQIVDHLVSVLAFRVYGSLYQTNRSSQGTADR